MRDVCKLKETKSLIEDKADPHLGLEEDKWPDLGVWEQKWGGFLELWKADSKSEINELKSELKLNIQNEITGRLQEKVATEMGKQTQRASEGTLVHFINSTQLNHPRYKTQVQEANFPS